MQIKKISILGLGLIGGSIAKAVKAAGENIAISAFDKKHRVLQKAKRENIIDEILKSVEDSINSDLIILAMPVDKSLEAFETLLPLLTRKNIITDVCGIKNIFEEKRNNIESQGHYIGAHPMAGNEASGFENSDPDLFEGTKYIISSF
ncbi:MAG TPA: prephenate dehydrogenase/arogenate dehydrogenase family protein, partial [Ignavibacteriaceae bacterium]|nr:prephenate dehydrogenase/arogenate dehydrogenase family protein [Ignavibacteriaceae bacterium]